MTGPFATKWSAARWTAPALLLLVPLIAMQFTDEVVWTAFDFAFAAVMLFGAAGLYELAARRIERPAMRLLAGALILGGMMFVWGWLATAG